MAMNYLNNRNNRMNNWCHKYMKKTFLITFLFVFFLLAPKTRVLAAPIFKSFGGRVAAITKSGGGVICTGNGTLTVLLSNLTGAAKIGTSQFEQNKANRATGTISGIYKSIPYYTDNPSKQPKVGGFILGKANIAPDFSKCHINIGEIQIPIPVLVTRDYNVSKK